MTTALSVYPSRRSRNEFRTMLIGWTITDPRFSYEKFTCPGIPDLQEKMAGENTRLLKKISQVAIYHSRS